MAKKYVPDRGDLIWLEFDPQAGREQAGHRPGIILSPKRKARRVGQAPPNLVREVVAKLIALLP